MGRTYPIVMLTIAAGVVACWPALRPIVDYWNETELLSGAHGYVVAGISAWCIWRVRAEVDAAKSAPSWSFVIVTALLSFVWYLEFISGLEVGYQMLVPMLLWTAVAGAVGVRVARTVGFALAYLWFAVPIWGYLSGFLVSLSSRAVASLALVTGVPAYVDGNTVHIPSGSILISGGCSGLNYFIVALAIAALYGELERQRLRYRVMLLGIAAVMAIVMNWVRIFGIVLDAHLTDMRGYLISVDHYKYGWVLFGGLLVAFFWIARRILPVGDSMALAPGPSTAVFTSRLVALVAVLAALAIGPALTAAANMRAHQGNSITLTLPDAAGDWRGPGPAGSRWIPYYPTADAEALGEYEYAGTRVSAYVNGYVYQAQGHELVGHDSNVFGESGWRELSSRRSLARGQSAAIPYVESVAAERGQQRWVIGYYYSVGDRNFTGSTASKLYYGLAVLQGRPRTGIVAVASECSADCSVASTAVNGFLAANGQALAAAIYQGRGAT